MNQEEIFRFGYVIMDGNSTLFGRCSANGSRVVIERFSNSSRLPKKHGKGGAYALHLAAKRQADRRAHYVRKAATFATNLYVNPESDQANVEGLILATCEFGPDLKTSDFLHHQLKIRFLAVVEVDDRDDDGFLKAIVLSDDVRARARLIIEENIVNMINDGLKNQTSVYGVFKTPRALEQGNIETLAVSQDTVITRFVLRNAATGETTIRWLFPYQEDDSANFRDDNVVLEIDGREPLIDWLLQQQDQGNLGCSLEVISRATGRGEQFWQCRCGIGAILKHQPN